MTVKELKKVLQSVADDVEIEIQCNGEGYGIQSADYFTKENKMSWNGAQYEEIVIILTE